MSYYTQMTSLYPYTYMSEGTGPWWGIRCSRYFYERMVRELADTETTRCFVYLTNDKGDTLAIAVEGPHNEGENIFAPDWVFARLGLSYGDEVVMEAILEPLPKGTTVTLRPLTGDTVEGPMFLEGLTEALNQLGVVQEGLLSAIVDPSMPELHEFMIESLTPARVCLADGELRVELERALDRPPSPLTLPEPPRPGTPIPEPVGMFSDDVFAPVKKGFTAFGGTGYRLDGKSNR